MSQSKWNVELGREFSPFTGRQAMIDAPDRCNMMIVCTNNGYGLVPWRLKLLHQLYEADLGEIMKERPDTKSVVCIPASSDDYVTAWEGLL